MKKNKTGILASSSDSEKDERIKRLEEENLRLEKEVSYLEGNILMLREFGFEKRRARKEEHLTIDFVTKKKTYSHL